MLNGEFGMRLAPTFRIPDSLFPVAGLQFRVPNSVVVFPCLKSEAPLAATRNELGTANFKPATGNADR